jgi:hypothetical protein
VRTPEIRCLLKNDLRQPLIGKPDSNKNAEDEGVEDRIILNGP